MLDGAHGQHIVPVTWVTREGRGDRHAPGGDAAWWPFDESSARRGQSGVVRHADQFDGSDARGPETREGDPRERHRAARIAYDHALTMAAGTTKVGGHGHERRMMESSRGAQVDAELLLPTAFVATCG